MFAQQRFLTLEITRASFNSHFLYLALFTLGFLKHTVTKSFLTKLYSFDFFEFNFDVVLSIINFMREAMLLDSSSNFHFTIPDSFVDLMPTAKLNLLDPFINASFSYQYIHALRPILRPQRA